MSYSLDSCPGPDECFDDLCRGQDRGLCGKWSKSAPGDAWGEEYEDETMVDLGGGMVVPLREVMEP